MSMIFSITSIFCSFVEWSNVSMGLFEILSTSFQRKRRFGRPFLICFIFPTCFQSKLKLVLFLEVCVRKHLRSFKGPIGFASEVVYNILIKLKVCSKTTYQYDVAAPTNITIRYLIIPHRGGLFGTVSISGILMQNKRPPCISN